VREHQNQKYAYDHRALILLILLALIDNGRTKYTSGRDTVSYQFLATFSVFFSRSKD